MDYFLVNLPINSAAPEDEEEEEEEEDIIRGWEALNSSVWCAVEVWMSCLISSFSPFTLAEQSLTLARREETFDKMDWVEEESSSSFSSSSSKTPNWRCEGMIEEEVVGSPPLLLLFFDLLSLFLFLSKLLHSSTWLCKLETSSSISPNATLVDLSNSSVI